MRDTNRKANIEVAGMVNMDGDGGGRYGWE